MDVDSYNRRHRVYFFNTGSIIKSGVFAVYLLHLSRLVLNGASSFRLLKNPQSKSAAGRRRSTAANPGSWNISLKR